MCKLWMRLGIILISLFLVFVVTHANAQDQANGLADTPWPMYQHDPQHTGRSPLQGSLQEPELLWTVQLRQCLGESGGISIALDGSLLNSIGGCLSNFDPITRQIRWLYQYGDNSRSVPLVTADQTLYWGFGMAFVQVAPTGGTNWLAELDPNFVFGSSSTFGMDGNLYFVHDGVWSFTTLGDYRWFVPYGEFGSHASPAIGLDGNIYAGTTYGIEDICAYTMSGGIAWCLDIPGLADDRTVSVGTDGTIYVPTSGNPVPPFLDLGVLVAVDPSGSVKWHFHPDEPDIFEILDGIAIGPDGSVYFGLNITSTPDSYSYSINSSGQFQWQLQFSGNTLTGLGPRFAHPITIDRTGNAFICLENSRCYGMSSAGAVMWEFEFPLTDSVITVSATQPIIAQDGIFYLVDNHQMLYAYADPSQYPILKTSTEKIDLFSDLAAPVLSTTIPITSTAMPITFTASVDPQVDWLSIIQPAGVTPAQLQVQIDPSALLAGNYHASIVIEPADSLQSNITIPVNLRVGTTQYFLPLTLNLNQSSRILFRSEWFVEHQLATFDRSSNRRGVISNDLPLQIDALAYSPDGRKVALVPYVNGKHQIIVRDTETGETILKIIESNRVFYPAWSPDSKRIAFVSYEQDQYNGEVYVINLDGTGLTRLTNNNLNETDMFWSPDSSKIAVQVRFSWIYTMNSDGTDFHQIEIGHHRDVLQGWSPDGRYFLLASQLTNDLDPYILGKYELQTGIYTFLADNFIGEARWSPDGARIVYVAHEEDSEYDWDIFTINSDGTGNTNLTHELGNEDSQPAWSPNNSWIAFSSRNDELYDDPNYDIYVVKIDGTGLQQITKNIQADDYPFWKP